MLALSTEAIEAQVLTNSDPGSSVRTRADLERLLQEYAQALASPAYSESVKRMVRTDADLIRGRLTNGDFRVGDRIVLFVQGEADLPDTVAVQPGPMIALPLFGEISLFGVLRSEVSAHLARELGRFIRDPIVRANGLMRLSVQGSVGSPGFYTMPAEMLVGEALMVAGGPTAQASMDEIHIDRGSQPFMDGELLQEAIRQGLTLDQLNLQAGDQIVVPAETPGGAFLNNLGIVAGIAGSLTAVIILLIR
ncbi:MAG: polysaccharide biosynthesis/export family protein [Gemmatimonadota bacterium]|nr:polysaccharide biosynthesis/export family protein [Gemmatimonadota bacterium]